MGNAVGAVVGAAVGDAAIVGEAVGAPVGAVVGAVVGAAVVGAGPSPMVGDEVGDEVGDAVGVCATADCEVLNALKPNGTLRTIGATQADPNKSLRLTPEESSATSSKGLLGAGSFSLARKASSSEISSFLVFPESLMPRVPAILVVIVYQYPRTLGRWANRAPLE